MRDLERELAGEARSGGGTESGASPRAAEPAPAPAPPSKRPSRVIGVGATCPGCGSVDTLITRTAHPSDRRYPAHIAIRLRARWHLCTDCGSRFRTER